MKKWEEQNKDHAFPLPTFQERLEGRAESKAAE